MAKTLATGSAQLRDAINTDNATEVIATTGAVTNALSLTKGVTILAPTGNTTGLTLAAPTSDMIGQTKTIANTTAFSAAVTVSGTAFAAQDVFNFVAAANGVIGPSVTFKVVDVSATAGTITPKWVVIGSAGFAAGTSATT